MIIATLLALLFALVSAVSLFFIVDHFRNRRAAVIAAVSTLLAFVVLYWMVWVLTLRPFLTP